MIRSWRNSATRKIWDGEQPNQFRGLDFEAAIDLLLALNVAKSLNDLSPLKSVGLHKLRGDRRGQWAMTVNQRWRICFEFHKGDAHEVEIVDYHKVDRHGPCRTPRPPIEARTDCPQAQRQPFVLDIGVPSGRVTTFSTAAARLPPIQRFALDATLAMARSSGSICRANMTSASSSERRVRRLRNG